MVNYWELLPKNNKAVAYKAMCFVKYLLDLEGIADFKAETIADKSNGLFNKSIIGRTLGLLQCKSEKKAERVNGKPNRRRYWDAQTVYAVYSTWGIDAWDLEQCVSISDKDIVGKQGKTTAFSGKIVNKKTINPKVTTSYKAVDIPAVNVPYFITYWNDVFNNRYSYSDSYSFVSRLPFLIHNTFKADKSYCSDGISPCIELPKEHIDTKGYSFINQSLLNKLGLPDLDINSLASKYNHRLIAQVNEPTRPWQLPRGHKDYLSVHHLCFNRSCINKDHLMIMLESLHTALHNSLPEEKHPYYTPHLYFDKVETNTINKLIKPTSNVIPFYKVNRNNGVDYNPNLLIDLGDGMPIKITTLPNHMLHNFEEGLNYKGK
tara:strand:+ start:898 stop:2025 length:1128 start_codon:yes stop_codon:yes gene_type:complete